MKENHPSRKFSASRRLQKVIFLFCLSFLLGAGNAFAGFGGGIGVTFPIKDGGGSDKSSSTYASFSADKIVYELNLTQKKGKLSIEFEIINQGDAPYSIPHRDGQKFDFELLDKEGKILWQWSDSMTFTQALQTTTYPPGETIAYRGEIDSKTYGKLKKKGAVLVAYLKDTPYRLAAKVPTDIKESRPVTLHGGIILGNGHWTDD